MIVSGREDFETITRELIEKQKIRISLIDQNSGDREIEQPPQTPATMQSMGFDGFLGDLIDAPAPVMSVLRSRNRIHQTVLFCL